MTLYPLCDYLSLAEREALGIESQAPIGYESTPTSPGKKARAVATGEKRPPRKGEWYLSGAIVGAYRAPNDLSTPYQIARVVLVEFLLAHRIVKELP